MNLVVLKGILALTATSVLFAGSAILYRRRGTVGSVLQLLGVACFVVVALAHIFEALTIFPALGWGQPRSIGHYIDLGAAVLGVALVSAGLLLQYVWPCLTT
jgi:succinate dehydrogenase/fumarate reductase cytochrome b subunit